MKAVLESISAGYSFRVKIQPTTLGGIQVVQMKDLDHSYQTITANLTQINGAGIKEKYRLKTGDVLFLSKGPHNYAAVFIDTKMPTVATSAFFVLRPDQNKIMPEYLAWYINQEPVQHYLAEHRSGTYTLNVNRAVVENIPMQIPHLSRQNAIVKIARLQKKEANLQNELNAKRKRLISFQLLNYSQET